MKKGTLLAATLGFCWMAGCQQQQQQLPFVDPEPPGERGRVFQDTPVPVGFTVSRTIVTDFTVLTLPMEFFAVMSKVWLPSLGKLTEADQLVLLLRDTFFVPLIQISVYASLLPEIVTELRFEYAGAEVTTGSVGGSVLSPLARM